MALWSFIQVLLIIAIIIFMASQVIYPAFSDMPFFWLFKKSYKGLENAKIELTELEVEDELSKIKAEVEAKKKKRQEAGD